MARTITINGRRVVLADTVTSIAQLPIPPGHAVYRITPTGVTPVALIGPIRPGDKLIISRNIPN